MPTYTLIEEYLNDQPTQTKEALLTLREYIMSVTPEATQLINYNIMAFALIPHGKRDQQIMIAGYKHHVGLYPGAKTMERFKEQLKEYTQGKGSVQFPLTQPLPKDLICDMVKYKKKLLLS